MDSILFLLSKLIMLALPVQYMSYFLTFSYTLISAPNWAFMQTEQLLFIVRKKKKKTFVSLL